MGDKIKRDIMIKGLSHNDARIEKIEALSDLSKLYRKQIKAYLNEITSNKTIQAQIKKELDIIN